MKDAILGVLLVMLGYSCGRQIERQKLAKAITDITNGLKEIIEECENEVQEETARD